MAWTYILKAADDSYYVGSTRNLDQRMAQHHSGLGAEYTSRRLPVELVWAHQSADVGTAYALEKQIQNWSRAKREALIAGKFDLLPGLAKKRWDRP